MRLVEYYGASKWDLSLHTDRSLSKTPYRELFLRAVNGKPIKLLRKLGTGANAPTVTEAESSGLFHLAQIPPPRKFMLDSQHRYRIEIPLANLELMSLLDKQLVTVLSDWKRKSVEVTFLSSHLWNSLIPFHRERRMKAKYLKEPMKKKLGQRESRRIHQQKDQVKVARVQPVQMKRRMMNWSWKVGKSCA